MRALAIVALAACSYAPHTATVIDDAVPQPDANDAPAPDAGIDLTAGLIAYYEMESIAGNVATDSTGHGHTGTCTSCPTPTTGKLGNGFHFNGGQRVDVTDDVFQTTTGFTIALWVQFTTLPATGFACPAGKPFGAGTSNSWQICFEAQTNDWMLVSAPTSSTLEFMNTGNTPVPNTWIHVAATWDGTTKSMWIDGQLLMSVAATIGYDAQPLTFGGDIDNGGGLSATINGDLDELRVYDHPLAADAIQLLATP